MVDQWDHLKVRTSVKQRLMTECVEEFLRYNPKFKGMRLTQNFMVQRLVEHYLEDE